MHAESLLLIVLKSEKLLQWLLKLQLKSKRRPYQNLS